MAIDRLGYLYVSNFDEHVWRVNPLSGQVRLVADGLYAASGNLVTRDGDLLQAEFSAGRIVRIGRRGNVSTFSDEGLAGPVGLSYGPGGDVYVANCLGGNVARMPASGGPARIFATHELFNCPNGITADDEGNLYVVNNSDTYVFKITPGGETSVFAHLPGVGHGHVVFADGALYIAQLWNHKIVRLDLDGTIETIAGNGRPGLLDGPSSESTVTHPNGITVSPRASTLYVNNIRGPMAAGSRATLVIRRISLPAPRSVLRAAYERGGVEKLKHVYAAYRDGNDMKPDVLIMVAQSVAYVLLQQGELEAGIALHEMNVETHPNSPVAHAGLAQAHAQYGDRERAMTLFERALSLDPDNGIILKKLEGIRGSH